jgi:hypothetical protein
MLGDPPERPAALAPATEGAFRTRIIRDAAVFQLKLLLDGAKDVVLSPVALAAALLDLIRGPTADPLFDQVLRLGAAIGRWINVYGEESPSELDELIGRLDLAYQERKREPSERRRGRLGSGRADRHAGAGLRIQR